MADLKVVHIWNPETGITDIPTGESLDIPDLLRIETEWAATKQRFDTDERLARFDQQTSRAWAIETGIIENLYDIERGVTETLIAQGFRAAILEHGSTNKESEFVISLLQDQLAALENLFAFVKRERELSVGYICELHALLCRSQETVSAQDAHGSRIEIPFINGEWKSQPNYPRRNGTVYEYCPPEQVASEMDRLVAMHLAHVSAGVPAETEAAWLHHRFSQIHPFQDGNGRVARSLATLVLIRGGLFPLMIPREEKSLYISALEHAAEGELRPLVLMIGRLQQVTYRNALAALGD